ncbi:MAG: DUF927 domain-containing protein [Desulfobulbaceae bacterium]|nr:DUF927 domain-containing protein [Desulfobulbaceae bacterium]
MESGQGSVFTKKWEGEAIIPEGFGIDERGLWYLRVLYNSKVGAVEFAREYITQSPVWMVRNYRKLEPGSERDAVSDPDECFLAIRHLDNGTVREQVIAKSLLYAGNMGATLGGKFNFTLRRDYVESFKDYLEHADMACKATESYRDQTGWIEIESGVWRFGLYQDNGLLIRPGGGISKTFESIRQKGDRETYLRVVLTILTRNPLACIPFAGAVAAPLLSRLKASSGVIDICGSSSKGKTVAARMAMAVYGHPKGLETQWSSTAAGLEGSLEFFNDLPVFFDDAQNQGDKKTIGKTIYQAANRIGRQKGKPSGGVQDPRGWSNFVFSTSEKSLISLVPEKYSGILARIIPVAGDTLGNCTRDDVRELEAVIDDHYGWVGRDLITYLESQADFDAIISQHRDYKKQLDGYVAADDRIQGRKADMYAALLCGIDALVNIYPLHNEALEIIKANLVTHWESLCVTGSANTSVQHALSLLIDHYNKSPHHFDGTSVASKGILYKPQDSSQKLIGFYPSEFYKIIKSAGYSSENILTEFMDRDWIVYRTTPKRAQRNPLIRTTRANDEIKLIVISEIGREAYNRDFS